MADATAKRTFILEGQYQPDNGYAYPAVVSYDPSTFTLAGALYFNLATNPISLTRWGNNGFAFLTNVSGYGDFSNPTTESQLVLFRSNLVPSGTVPVVTLSATSLTFALQPVTIASASQTVTVSNTGTAPLTGFSIGLAGADLGSFVTSSTYSSSLAAGGSCTVSVVFNPNSAGSKQATLQIMDNAADGPQTVTLSGTASVPSFVLSSQSLSFGQLPVGASAQQVLTLQNSSAVPVANISLAMSGQNAADFTATSNCGSSLAPGGNCTVSVTFMPSVAGSKSATLTLVGGGCDGTGSRALRYFNDARFRAPRARRFSCSDGTSRTTSELQFQCKPIWCIYRYRCNELH